MTEIRCSVWNNGGSGWGLRILGGPSVRDTHFDRKERVVMVDLDGEEFPFNIDKGSFWRKCPELIGWPLKNWFAAKGLRSGDRLWLRVVESKRRFRATC